MNPSNKIKQEIVTEFKRCLTCKNELEVKQMRKGQIRCKKCQREYGKVWPESSNDFYDMFKGQI